MILSAMLTALTVLAYVMAATSAVMLAWFVFRPSTTDDQRHKRFRRGAEIAMTGVIAGFSADALAVAGASFVLVLLHLIQHECDVEMGF